MHFQYPPAAETKLVRCTRGAILDIIVDLRPGEPEPTSSTSPSSSTHDNMTRALRAGALRARLSGAAGQHRYELSGGRILHAERRRRTAATTIRGSGSVAAAGVGDLRPKDRSFRPFREIEGELKLRMSLPSFPRLRGRSC